MATEWLKTNEYAEKKHLHPQRVRYLCAKGEIKAERVGKTWRIPYQEPPDTMPAQEAVVRAVDSVMAPCVAVVDAGIAALQEMRRKLKETEKELMEGCGK